MNIHNVGLSVSLSVYMPRYSVSKDKEGRGNHNYDDETSYVLCSCQYNLYELKNVTVERKILVTLQLEPPQRSSLLRLPQRSRNLSLKDPL